MNVTISKRERERERERERDGQRERHAETDRGGVEATFRVFEESHHYTYVCIYQIYG